LGRGLPDNVAKSFLDYGRDYYLFKMGANSSELSGLSLESHIPSNAVVQAVAWIERLVDDYLVESAVSATPPAARLVGIETNPGPPPNSSSPAAAIAAFGAALGSAIAKTKKKKTSGKKAGVAKSRKRSANLTIGAGSFKSTPAPVGMGFSLLPRQSTHTPFIVRGRGLMGQVKTNGSGVVYFTNRDGAGAVAVFNMDPCGVGTNQNDWLAFPTTITKISECFVKYRLRKLVLHYIPYCPTTSSGCINIGCMKEVVVSTYVPTTDAVSTFPASMSTSVYTGCSLDLLMDQGLSREWRFLDSTPESLEAGERQESVGSVMIQAQGVGTNVAFGSCYIDYEIEYDGLAVQNAFAVSSRSPRVLDCSSVPPSDSQVPDLSDSVYLPSTLLSKMGLQRRTDG